MVEYFRPKVRPGAGWTYPTGVGPVGGVMSDPNLFYSHVGLGAGSKDFPPYTKAPMANAPSYAFQSREGLGGRTYTKTPTNLRNINWPNVSGVAGAEKPVGFHHEQQGWVDMQILNSPLNTEGLAPEKIYEAYMGLGQSKASEKTKEKQSNRAGKIIEESIARAKETRPELWPETAGPPSDQILPSQSVSNEILPPPPESILPQQQSRFSNLRPLGPGDPGLYGPSGIEAPLVTYGEAVDRREPSPPPPEAPELLQQEVSGEQAAAVPIDPADLVGGSFFGPTGELVNPGSGFRYSDPVLKGAAGGPFSEARALAGEGADWQKFVGPAMTAIGGSQIPGAGLLGLFAAGLNKLGAYDQFNPATDSNLFADPETGRATWGTTDPGGSGSQRGTLNLYNMLQDFGGSYPNRQVQTPSRKIYHEDGSSSMVPQYANARDLAYIMGQGDRPPPGLYTQQTPLGYQDFGEDSNVTNQEALNTYNRTGAGAILNEAGAILGPDAGYNETSDLAASMAENLQDQMDYSDQDWGDWI
jgi:hypothetical protein